MKEEKKQFAASHVGSIFWMLFAVNYVVMALFRYVHLPLPVSIFAEIFYFLAICHVAGKSKQYGGTAGNACGPMLFVYLPWLVMATFEICNTTSQIDYGTIAYRWFAEVRNLGYQVVYGLFIYAGIFNTRERIRRMHRVWGYWVIAAVAKVLMQQYVGFDYAEREFLVVAARTHFVQGIIRYFSFFSDAANFGSSMAATVTVFAALAFTTRNRRDRIFFSAVSVIALYGMMASGTRSAIIALAVGLMSYAFLSRNFKAFAATGLVGLSTVGFLMFTDIGQGNNMIRRMRSAFNKDDASLGVREINKKAMESYLINVPIGIGAGIANGDIPPSNPHYFLSVVPPDSTWVYITIRYGHVGKYCFLFSFFGMCVVGVLITFRLKHPEVTGQMAATVSGAFAMTVAGYSNHIMLQYPNCLIFFGALGMLTVAELVDRKAIEADEHAADPALPPSGEAEANQTAES